MGQQFVKPKQIAPSGTDGDVLTTVAGVAQWALDAGSSTSIWEPLTNGDPVSPELIFDGYGDVIMVEVPI